MWTAGQPGAARRRSRGLVDLRARLQHHLLDGRARISIPPHAHDTADLRV